VKKNYEIWSTFAEVILKIKVAQFFETPYISEERELTCQRRGTVDELAGPARSVAAHLTPHVTQRRGVAAADDDVIIDQLHPPADRRRHRPRTANH